LKIYKYKKNGVKLILFKLPLFINALKLDLNWEHVLKIISQYKTLLLSKHNFIYFHF